jgi:heme-degrading monooxygenase HmoA
MRFREDMIDTFLQFFNERKQIIRNFAGCHHLELWRDTNERDIFFTYSHWESASALDHYRYSDFFKETWTFTKQHFSAKAEAYSIEQVVVER